MEGTPGPVFVELPIDVLYPFHVVQKELGGSKTPGAAGETRPVVPAELPGRSLCGGLGAAGAAPAGAEHPQGHPAAGPAVLGAPEPGSAAAAARGQSGPAAPNAG
ncbi:uncharacterized protein LOC115917158 [Camarhynchus parvulus]|uniref:uncharacterized protein LOC115917158 n=1 Tax=Geospiza parvula TaxID=87175 RepID=UPI001237CA27|nr:uncharacterized protein LOC115917158 [Camarhynchus parvulus]